MNMIKNETSKLLRRKQFRILMAVLFLGNLLVLYSYQKQSPAYHYVYEQKERYLQFLEESQNADLLSDDSMDTTDAFYRNDQIRQQEYQNIYPDFLNEMQERSDNLKKFEVISDENSFAYRNLDKTCRDFSDLKGTKIQQDNCFGIRAFADYDLGILFLLMCVVIICWFLVFEERDTGLFLLTKGTKHGHTPLILGKLTAAGVMTAVYILLQEIFEIGFLGWMYGYGDLGRSIQSVPEFRNCPYRLTVGEGLLAMVGIRVFTAIVVSFVMVLLSIMIRNAIAAILTAGILFGAEFAIERIFSISGSFNIIKCINPFFCWNMISSLGTYQNLNLFGHAAGKANCAFAAGIVLWIACLVLGVYIFNNSYQIHTQSRLESVFLLVRKKNGFFWRHTHLLRFEGSKVLWQQKRWIVFVFLIIWSVGELSAQMGIRSFSDPAKAVYTTWISDISGPVTEESLQYIRDKEDYLHSLEQKMQQYGEELTPAEQLSLQITMDEYSCLSSGASLLFAQRDALMAKPGSIYDKYWVNEPDYEDKINDRRMDITAFMIGGIAVILCTCCIYPADEKKKTVYMLRATRRGRNYFERRKNLCGILLGILCFFLSEFPVFFGYYRIDHFRAVRQKLCDMTRYQYQTSLTLGGMIALIFLVKFVIFLLLSILVLKLSRVAKNETVTAIISCGIILILGFICYHFRFDVGIVLSQLLMKF